MQIKVGEYKLWRVDDGSLHFIAAKDEDGVKSIFEDYCIGECMAEGEEVEITPCQKDINIFMVDEEGQPTFKASELMVDLTEPVYIGGEEW